MTELKYWLRLLPIRFRLWSLRRQSARLERQIQRSVIRKTA